MENLIKYCFLSHTEDSEVKIEIYFKLFKWLLCYGKLDLHSWRL